jgi:hypothetical protein
MISVHGTWCLLLRLLLSLLIRKRLLPLCLPRHSLQLTSLPLSQHSPALRRLLTIQATCLFKVKGKSEK